MGQTITSVPANGDELHALDQVMDRMSKLLRELSVACLEVQAAGAELKEEHSPDAIVKTQALDRITQSLECLSNFHAALSQTEGLSGNLIGENEFASIRLDSVRAVLEDRVVTSSQTDADDISLFDE